MKAEVIIAMGLIATIEVVALATGHNGVMLTASVAGIVGIATYKVGKNKGEKNGRSKKRRNKRRRAG